MIDQNIKDRLSQLNPTYVEFIKSDFAHGAAKELSKATQFDEDQTNTLSNGIMLYLLVFLNFEELVEFISSECKVSSEQAFQLAGAVISSLPDEFTKMHQAAYGSISGEKPSKTGGVGEDLASDIAETEATMNAIPTPPTPSSPHIRTMAGDMTGSQTGGEVTHSSTQADILNNSQPVAPENAPRWESEAK